MSMYYSISDSPLGAVIAATASDHLSGVWFHDRVAEEKLVTFGTRVEPEESAVLGATFTQLDEYFNGKRKDFNLPLAPRGTPHQERIWDLLLDIEFGATTTYGELARRRGIPAGAQSVGQAVGRNPISVIIPCHRVVGSRGVDDLTGYAGGLERKRYLLELEGVLSVQPTLIE